MTDTTSCAVCRSLESATPIWQDDLWHVRPIDPPTVVPGWTMLVAKRHVAGPAHFTDDEARTFGPVLRHVERLIETTTGALRVYTAALGESSPHFHCHMVPRYASMPRDAKGWAVFDLERAARAGEVSMDPAEVVRIDRALRAALAASPPPR